MFEKLIARHCHIIEHRRKVDGRYVLLIQRAGHMPFITGIADTHSLSLGEWYWGHYFEDLESARADYLTR